MTRRDTYFADHWREISADRHEVYERILAWGPMWEPLFEPAEVGEGHVVLDLGAGPGHVAVEMAGRVGPAGHVHAVDINDEFLQRTRRRAVKAGLGQRVSTHRVDGPDLPVGDGCIDRVLAKNVLEYVPDLAATLAECFRVTTPGGRMTATDSDWEFLVFAPWSVDEQRRFFTAGHHAFNEPCIGRELRGAMLDTGYVDVSVNVHTTVDTSGAVLGVIHNFAGYIAEFDTLPTPEVDEMIGRLTAAVHTGRFLAVLPQFSITGHRPTAGR